MLILIDKLGNCEDRNPVVIRSVELLGAQQGETYNILVMNRVMTVHFCADLACTHHSMATGITINARSVRMLNTLRTRCVAHSLVQVPL